MSSFRDRYGQHPLHLIAVIASFAIAGAAFLQIADRPDAVDIAIWFIAAIVLHDLIAFPLYSLLGVIAGGKAGQEGRALGAVNYIRVPVILSAFVFIVWFPFILSLDSATYEAASGQTTAPFLERWLLITGGLFLISGVLYALRARALRKGPPPAESEPAQ